MSQILIEGIVLIMVCFAPWAYGGVHAGFELLLDAGVFLLTVVWSVRILCEGKLAWQKCPVSLGLAGLFLFGIWQTVPLNRILLERVSPATARWYNELLPMSDEELPFGQSRTSVSGVGMTISLYPDATRRTLRRILAVLLIFLVVRNNLESSGSFRRLGIAVLCNGACLALFALVQFFSSPRHLLYWTYPSMGMQVFGPFIYRNHYACYMNLCIGSGLGLLWSHGRALADGTSEDGDSAGPRTATSGPTHWSRSFLSMIAESWTACTRLLRDPASMWICAALALMAGSVMVTLSRGGFVALIGGFVVCFIIQIASSARFLRLGTALMGLAMTFGLLGWLGLARIEARFATLWGGTALGESRLLLWSAAPNIVKDFPVWGTGYGTCQYVDPLYRSTAEVADLTIDHLHNDHLELLVESGVAGLLLTWFTLGLVFWLGFRAVRSRRETSGLALGALFSISTLVLHGFGDFLISVPAIALLATVLCARICIAGSKRRKDADPSAGKEIVDQGRYELHFHGLAPLLGAAMLMTLGLLVLHESWTQHNAASLRQAAYQKDQDASLAGLEHKKDLLESAVRLTPRDAELRTELADTYAELFRQQQDVVHSRSKVLDGASVVLLLASRPCAGSAQPVLATLPRLSLFTSFRHGLDVPEQRVLVRKYLVPALDNYLQARDSAPLLAGPHLGLALHAERMQHADPAQVYMSRVQRLAPADPTFWYFCGNQQLRMGQPDEAWKSWRRCLELSDRFLTAILDRSQKFLGSEALIDEVLPPRPALLADAAVRLFPSADKAMLRKPFLERALLLLNAQPTPWNTTDLRTKASLYQSLGRSADAVKIYRDILQREPLQFTWRYELADALYRDGNLDEARAELVTVLAQQPKHAQAYDLWMRIMKELVQRK